MLPDQKRLFRALEREGLRVSRDGAVYSVATLQGDSAPTEILLPAELPLEVKAVRQLANLAASRHPDGGHVCRACATPDFHPGDSGVAIGSVVEMKDLLIPQGVGVDINCGMRLHTFALSWDAFQEGRTRFVDLLKGDYLLGTRDVEMDATSSCAMYRQGAPAWVDAFRKNPRGRLRLSDLDQIESELDRVDQLGSLEGDVAWAPEKLVPSEGIVRDDGLATIGRGNHFVEIQVVEEIVDRHLAYAWGLAQGQMTFMIHSGSRNIGQYVGKLWEDKARHAWPKGSPYPASGIFPLSWASTPELCKAYLQAEATASNYGFVNRLLLAELMRLRLREVYGPSVEAPLVYDAPHNITLKEGEAYVTRKGACPAHAGQPVIIPGSMGAPSYVCVGLGNTRFLSSASHGAGRAHRRGEMRQGPHGLEGVDCITLREERKIEEAPAAYKPIQPVIDAQVNAGSVRVVVKLRPILTFKA